MKVCLAYLPISCTQVPKRNPIAGITYMLKHSWVQIEHVSESELELESEQQQQKQRLQSTWSALGCSLSSIESNYVQLSLVSLERDGTGPHGMGWDTAIKVCLDGSSRGQRTR